jgi:endonuclease/exonuclease/phosphatase family metal-dependent hydrolase
MVFLFFIYILTWFPFIQPEIYFQPFFQKAESDFVYIQDAGNDIEEKDTLCVFTCNVCFFDYPLSTFFGGLSSWKKRIDPIIEKITAEKADIVCLQEVFSPQASQELYRRLKGSYPNAYLHIGKQSNPLPLETFNVSSGLLVFSKYPLEEPEFVAFNKRPLLRPYGFFHFKVHLPNKAPIHLFTTHLQPGSSFQDAAYRKSQIQQLLKKMESQTAELATFLCGDLNIDLKSREDAAIILHKHFDDFLNHHGKKPIRGQPTWKDFKELTSAVLDYALFWRGSTYYSFYWQSKVVTMFDENAPEDGLSGGREKTQSFRYEMNRADSVDKFIDQILPSEHVC